MQGNKLYVGGVPYSATNESLATHFAAAGEVLSAMIIVDRMSGRSKGFGFVEMTDEAAAQKAISMFHDQDFMGRKLTVNVAKPMAPREERSRDDRPRRNYDDRPRRNF